MKEAFKLVVFPHGKVEFAPDKFAFKYVLGGVLLSSEELKMPIETLMMHENFSGALSEVLREGKKFTVSHPLGDLSNAIMMLGCFTPDHHNVEPV